MPPPKVSKQLSQAQVDDILSIGKSIRATKYDDRLEQRTFLDAKVLQLDAFSDYIPAIAERAELADVPHLCRNSYHQSAAIGGGAIGGRYGMITDFCSAIKLERERLKNKVLQEQQAHRAELEDARVAKEALESEVRASKEAARLAKEAAKKIKPKKKTRSSKVTVEDVDDEVSVVDEVDAQQAASASAVFNFIRDINTLCVGLDSFQLSSISSDNGSHRVTQSLDETVLTGLRQESTRAALVRISFRQIRVLTDFRSRESLQRSFPLPPPVNELGLVVASPMRTPANRLQALNSPLTMTVVKNTVAAAYSAIASSPYKATFESLRLEESNVRSQLAYSNAQLRYHLDHRQYLLDSLSRILDEQHKR
ncbi:hypothetical protein DFH09DRAFT_1307658 [Mycena vulgaris]|nr:hypothetical protein DFH09DRAFT_1307658 [Mycena vulgaris]